MRAAAILVAATLLAPTAAGAQGNPWGPNGNPWGPQPDAPRGDDDGDHDRDHRRPFYAGDFVFYPQGDVLLLLDTRTGCVWRRNGA